MLVDRFGMHDRVWGPEHQKYAEKALQMSPGISSKRKRLVLAWSWWIPVNHVSAMF